MEKKADISKEKGKLEQFFNEFIKFLKSVWILFKENIREIISFAFICTTVTLIVTQALDWLVSWMMTHVAGFAYMAKGNMLNFFKNPVSLLAIFLYLIFGTLFSLFEIAGLFHAFSMSQIGRKTNLSSMLAHGIRVVKKTLHPKNWGIIFFVIILMPLTGVLSMSTTGYKAAVPYFIIQGVESAPTTRILYIIGYYVLLLLEAIYLFSINVYVLQDVTFLQAMKKSRKLIQGNIIRTILLMFMLSLLVNFIIITISSALPTNIMELMTLFSRSSNVTQKSIHVGTYVYVLKKLLTNFFEPVADAAGLTALYYQYIDDKGMMMQMSRDSFRYKPYDPKDGNKYVFATVLFIIMMLGVQVWHYRYLADPVEKPIVCAHRGDNMHAPENTMPAFELALVENTPMIECDVIQTADGVVVCSHDYNLKRVTGQNIEISKSTFEQVDRVIMLSNMPGNFNNVKVPTLDELLQTVEVFEESQIQIELKPTPNDTNLEEEVVRMIHEYNLKDRCYVISLYYEPLLKVKELDPEIRTGIATIAAWDNYTEVKGVDVLSIADSGISPDLVKAMHEKGYQVMVWTVDDIDAVQYLVSCGVDVIGTNDPTVIQEGVDLADPRGGAFRIFHVLMHMFKGTEDSSLMKGKAS